jgi:hypothetical protein
MLVAVLVLTVLALSALLAVSAAANVKAMRALEDADRRIERLELLRATTGTFGTLTPLGPVEEHRLLADLQVICRALGYGRVMQFASEAWRQFDPYGAISLGPCFGELEPAPPRPNGATRR